jgi:hypothetical protein
VSYDSSLATTATVEMRVVNAADTAGTVASQLITIDTTAPAIAADAAVVMTTAADDTAKAADLKAADKVVLTIALGESASNLSGLPTGTDDTIVKVAGTSVTANWSVSGNDLLLTYLVPAGANGAVTIDEGALETALTAASIADVAGNVLTVPTFTEVTDPTNAIDTTDPSAPTYAVSGTDMTVTGEADADVYLIRDDGGTTAGSIKYDVIDKIGTDDIAALQNLLAQDTHEWARGTIASGGATGTIDTSGLMDGTYKLYQVDRAGNFSLVSTDGDLTISSSSVTDGDTSTHEYDVEFFSIDDGSTTHTDTASSVVSGGNNAVDLTFDLNDVAENDIVELYVDGQLAFSKEITTSDKTNGTITATNLDLDAKDVATGTSSSSVDATDNAVIIELRVKHQGVYVQDGQDVTWEYQW